MTVFINAVVLLAAALFIAVSASMNAVFLSSFGRTPLETSLLMGVSVAADAIKAVLPVVIMRALVVRAWGHMAMAGMMLGVVIAMSLASGMGFVSLARDKAIGARETQALALAARENDLSELERRLATLPEARPLARIEADIQALKLEPDWIPSKSCTQARGAALLQFCSGVFAVQAELATASERDRLVSERRTLRRDVETLRASGAATDGDPQAKAMSDLFGTDRRMPRMVLTTGMAIVLELGSLILILLAAGPALLGWREPGTGPSPPPVAATLPPSVDRAHWQRQRNLDRLTTNRGAGDGR